MIDPHGRVWCHLACQIVAVLAAFPAAAPVPHMDPRTVHVDAAQVPKLFGDHDVEDPPAPEWRVLSAVGQAASGGTAGTQPIVSQFRRPRGYGAGVAMLLRNHRTTVFSPPV